MILDPEDEAFNEIERRAKQRKEAVRAAINKEKPMNNPPAFPVGLEAFGEDKTGMTLRDYFAAKALQGLLSYRNADASIDEFAAGSYRMADAMLKAREK